MSTNQDELDSRGDAFSWELRRSARRRTVAVEVHRDLRVVVRAPASARAELIGAQVAARRAWIERTLARFRREGHAPVVPLAWASGAVHHYLGQPCRLDIVRGAHAAVDHAGGVIRVALRGEVTEERTRRALLAWYRGQALALARELVAAHFAPFAGRGHRPPALAVRRMTSRWGSMVGRRRMTLALALVHAPPECFEYVVVHELCHLEHRGHGRAFHGLMDRLLPDWRERRRRLDRGPWAALATTGVVG